MNTRTKYTGKRLNSGFNDKDQATPKHKFMAV